MILAADSHHAGGTSWTAGVLFRFIADAEPIEDVVVSGATPADYVPGELYRRELPGILSLLPELGQPPDLIIVDGYVALADGTPGLGAHLYRALDEAVRVIGVAKTPFRGADHARQLFRGGARRPLYITAAGLPLAHAEQAIRAMHGPHRIPALLKRADRLCREAAAPGT